MPFTQSAPSAFCAIPCQPWRGHCSPPLPAPAARISVPLTARPILLQTQIAALAASLDTELPEGNSGVGFRCVCLRGCRPAVGMLWPCHTSARSSASPRPSSLRVCSRSWLLATCTPTPRPPGGGPGSSALSVVPCTHAAVPAVSSATWALFSSPKKRQIPLLPKKYCLPWADLSQAPATPSPKASQRQRHPGICSSLHLARTQ